MKTDIDLERALAAIDRRGYPAYKQLHGSYDFVDFVLSIDHVQGDPFAAPSKLSVVVPGEVAGFPRELFDAPHRRVALEDLLIRRFSAEASRASFKVGGSGKSGLIATSRPGPEVLPRSACEVAADGSVTLRLEAGLPAHGRTVDGRAAADMLLDLIPRCAGRSLVCDDEALRLAREAADLADDQHAARAELARQGLVAFVADGSILPRATGVSSRPLAGATPFVAPPGMRVTLDLPHRGPTPGLGIRRGVTLVVGGGYHGKSTLLKALQEGVYDHVAGDGRELVVTDATAVKLRAEDGRAVSAVDISPFISNLPDGRDTHRFSTADASGSTSQAASTAEALEAGARVLLIDEDTSATNFMVRDELMEAVVAADHEPITPFVERVRALWEARGVSTVIVVGSSGAFFSQADAVLQMDAYEARDVTERVRAVCRERGIACAAGDACIAAPTPAAGDAAGTAAKSAACTLAKRAARRIVASAGADGAMGGGRTGRGDRGRGAGAARIKVRAHGLEGFTVGSGGSDLRQVEQLVDAEQGAALAVMVRAACEHGLLDGSRSVPDAVAHLYRALDERGWAALTEHGDVACGLARPRPQELAAAFNRWRTQRGGTAA